MCRSLKEKLFFKHKVGILHSNTWPENLSETHFNLSCGNELHPVIWQALVREKQGSTVIGWQVFRLDREWLASFYSG